MPDPVDELIRQLEIAEAGMKAMAERIESAEKALKVMVYGTTHLSPEEDDGSHWCKIPKEALSAARAHMEKYHGRRYPQP